MSLAHRIEIPQSIIDEWAAWYPQHPVPEVFATAHPLLFAHALRECDGDWRRCAVNPDGSIEIHNGRIW